MWAVKVPTRRNTDALARGEQLLFMSTDLQCGHSGGARKAFGRGLENRLGALGATEGRGLSSRLLGGMAVAAVLGSLSWAEARKCPRTGGDSSGAGCGAGRRPGSVTGMLTS